VGSLVAIPLFLWSGNAQQSSVLVTLAVLSLLVLGACWVAGRAEEILAEHDSHAIVIDEIVGYLAATAFLSPTWPHAIVAFLIFRIFDVVKPPPAAQIDERMAGGYGVVLDDVVSGIYANLATRVVFAFL
jgi:phosphatidylglycerophosphatase A